MEKYLNRNMEIEEIILTVAVYLNTVNRISNKDFYVMVDFFSQYRSVHFLSLLDCLESAYYRHISNDKTRLQYAKDKILKNRGAEAYESSNEIQPNVLKQAGWDINKCIQVYD